MHGLKTPICDVYSHVVIYAVSPLLRLLGYKYIQNLLHTQSEKQGKLFDEEAGAYVSDEPMFDTRNAHRCHWPGTHTLVCQNIPA